jgi:hypothetical protein
VAKRDFFKSLGQIRDSGGEAMNILAIEFIYLP